VRGAERHAGFGHPGAARFAGRQRDPKIRDHRSPVMKQNILWLDVAMDHFVAVGVVQRGRHFTRDSNRIGNRELLLPVQPIAQ
jgi:hypothetical protein